MEHHILEGKKRLETGRKVKRLRNKGLLPATIYGKHVKSLSISVDLSHFEKVYTQAGETGVIRLTVDSTEHPVLVHTVQTDPIRGGMLHVEFHQVDLKEKVHANVPVVAVGEPEAVSQKTGVLLTLLDEVEVEALPTDLPKQLDVDVTKLASVDDEFKVSDLTISSAVTVVTDPSVALFRIGTLVIKEAEPTPAAVAAPPTEEVAAATESGSEDVGAAEQKKE